MTKCPNDQISSPPDRQTIFADVGTAHQDARARIEQDSLIAAKRSGRRAGDADFVPALRQAIARRRRHVALDEQPIVAVIDARRLASLLNVHSEVDQIDYNLRVA